MRAILKNFKLRKTIVPFIMLILIATVFYEAAGSTKGTNRADQGDTTRLQIGGKVPDFTLRDIRGDEITLSNSVKDSNLILFWSSECPFCKSMLLKTVKWQKSLSSESFNIIAISLDADKEAWQKAVVELNFGHLINLVDTQDWSSSVTRSYRLKSTPTAFIIDQDLIIQAIPKNFDELKLFYE